MKICREITSYEELTIEFGDHQLPQLHSGSWCYLFELLETDLLPDVIPVAEYLNLLCTEKEAIYTYSVASNEPRYEEWVQAALDLQPIGATVTVLDRGNRFVYLCSIPTTPQELVNV